MTFPILKHMLVQNVVNQRLIPLSFPNPYLIVGLIAVENNQNTDVGFERTNLKPYELAVNKFIGCDFKYDLIQVNPPENRDIDIYGFMYDGNINPIIVCYLEFPKS